MSKSKVLFFMTGSIACYKACQTLSRLTQAGCEVQVVASASALQFVGTATLEGLTGKPVVTDMYASGNVMDHIHLMRWADLVVVAPASANYVNKAAQGIADDLLHTMFMAHDFKKPFLIAPAMNVAMYNHPLTQNSLQKLKDIGIEILDGGTGALACGENGQGRLIEADELTQVILKKLNEPLSLLKKKSDSPTFDTKGAKVLITSGGTQEPIDTVRVISNISSGRTGKELAEALLDYGFDVTLLRSHSSVASSLVPDQKIFTSFASLKQQLEEALATKQYTHVIHLAAVSDYSVATIEVDGQKVKPFEVAKLNSDANDMSIHLQRNPKLVHLLKTWGGENLQVIAFKLTSKASPSERTTAVQKLFQKASVDAIVHNDLTEIDIIKKSHRFTLYTSSDLTSPQSLDGTQNLSLALTHFILERKPQ